MTEQDRRDNIMDRADYERVYPNYCKACEGKGGFISYSPDVHFWECEKCVEQDICPRCGVQALDEMQKCSSCEWDRSDVEQRGLPEAK
jgi:hypothetical protein